MVVESTTGYTFTHVWDFFTFSGIDTGYKFKGLWNRHRIQVQGTDIYQCVFRNTLEEWGERKRQSSEAA